MPTLVPGPPSFRRVAFLYCLRWKITLRHAWKLFTAFIDQWLGNPWVSHGLGIVMALFGVLFIQFWLILAWGFFLYGVSRTDAIKSLTPPQRGLTLLIIGSFIGVGMVFLAAQLSCKVTISPDTQFLLNTSRGPNKTSLTITNQCEKSVYSVWIKIWTERKDITSGDILIDLIESEKNKAAPKLRAGVGYIDTDVGILEGRDKHGHGAILVNFYQLSPKESRHLTIYGNRPIESSARAEFIHFKNEPDKVFEEDGKAKIDRQTPEYFILEGHRFISGINK